MLTCDKLQALILQIIIHNTLIESSCTNGPLLNLAHDTLIALFGNTCNITVCVRILSTQFVGVVGEEVLDCDVDWTERTSREEMAFWELNIAVSFFRSRVVTLTLIIRIDKIQNVFHRAYC